MHTLNAANGEDEKIWAGHIMGHRGNPGKEEGRGSKRIRLGADDIRTLSKAGWSTFTSDRDGER